MGFPCQQSLWVDGDTPLRGMGRSVLGPPLCLGLPPSLPPFWISSPCKQHSYPGLCVSCQPFLSIPLYVRGHDLAPRVESFRPPPLPGHFFSRNSHYKSFQGPELWNANLTGTPTCNYHVIINTGKTLLSLPACSNDGSDRVQPPACLPPCFLTGMGQRLGCPLDQGSVCRGMWRACPSVMSMLFPPTLLQLRGQVQPRGTEMRMLSPSWESGDPTRTPASRGHSPVPYPLFSLRAPFMGQAWAPAVDLLAVGLGGEAMTLEQR